MDAFIHWLQTYSNHQPIFYDFCDNCWVYLNHDVFDIDEKANG